MYSTCVSSRVFPCSSLVSSAKLTLRFKDFGGDLSGELIAALGAPFAAGDEGAEVVIVLWLPLAAGAGWRKCAASADGRVGFDSISEPPCGCTEFLAISGVNLLRYGPFPNLTNHL